MSLLIKNGRVWDGEKFYDADVLTEGKTISRIERGIAAKADYVFDAAGKIVAPGLIDIHTHMQHISSDEFGIHAEMSCIPFGVTTACDASAFQGDKALISSFGVKASAFVMVDVKDDHIIKGTAEERLARYGERTEGLKLFFDTSSPDIRSSTPLREICAFARDRGLKVMVHSSNSPIPMRALIEQLSRGDILTHAYHGGVNNALDDHFECLRETKRRGIIVDAGFAGHVHTDFEVFKRGIEAGVYPDTISTDITRRSAYKRGGKYGMTLCMSLAKHLGLSEELLFRAVTSAPAMAIGSKQDSGFLRVGGIGDIAVFDENGDCLELTDRAGHHIFSPGSYRCIMTVIEGEIVYRI